MEVELRLGWVSGPFMVPRSLSTASILESIHHQTGRDHSTDTGTTAPARTQKAERKESKLLGVGCKTGDRERDR